jgi:hypothetical protein
MQKNLNKPAELLYICRIKDNAKQLLEWTKAVIINIPQASLEKMRYTNGVIYGRTKLVIQKSSHWLFVNHSD